MRLRDVGDLPAALTTAQLADLTGICQETWWAAARGEEEPPIDVEPIRAGRRGVLRWPTTPVLRALGVDTLNAGGRPLHLVTDEGAPDIDSRSVVPDAS